MKKRNHYKSLFLPIAGFILSSYGCDVFTSNNSNADVNEHNICFYNSPNIKNPKALKLFDLGLNLVEQGTLYEAKKDFYEANNLEPNNSIILNGLGAIHARLGAFDSAIDYYKLSLKTDSLYLTTYIDYGQTLNLANRYEEALGIFFKGKRIKYDSSVEYGLYLNIAVSYYYLKDCDKAKKYSDTARLLSANKERSQR